MITKINEPQTKSCTYMTLNLKKCKSHVINHDSWGNCMLSMETNTTFGDFKTQQVVL